MCSKSAGTSNVDYLYRMEFLDISLVSREFHDVSSDDTSRARMWDGVLRVASVQPDGMCRCNNNETGMRLLGESTSNPPSPQSPALQNECSISDCGYPQPGQSVRDCSTLHCVVPTS